MAEKSTATKKKAPPRQQMLDALAETEKTVSERREAQAKPEERIEARAIAQAVAAADELSTEGVVKSIGDSNPSSGKCSPSFPIDSKSRSPATCRFNARLSPRNRS